MHYLYEYLDRAYIYYHHDLNKVGKTNSKYYEIFKIIIEHIFKKLNTKLNLLFIQ